MAGTSAVQAWGTRGAWGALVAWMLVRSAARSEVYARLSVAQGRLTYLTVDASWVLLAAALLGLHRWPPSRRAATCAVVGLSAVVSVQHFAQAAARYFRGDARAWDLANYAQPLWRAAHGLSMSSATYEGRPVWADHGAFAMFGFAPFTRICEDAALGLFGVQAVLAAMGVLATYHLALALALPAEVALSGACVFASSRAIASAARFDFHPECALGLLLLAGAAAEIRGRHALALTLTLVATTLRDVAALSVAMLWVYWLVWPRHRDTRPVAALGAALAAAVVVVDLAVLPRLTGWTSYLALHGGRSVDLPLALQTTVLRGLSSFGIGWLHPIAWLTGAPWIAAAAASPKLIVKGIDFQYGFLFVPVAMLGALHLLAAVRARRALLSWGWATLAVAVNAPLPDALTPLPALAAAHADRREAVGRALPPDARVVADACAAPYVMERTSLQLLCRLDTTALMQAGAERWEAPVTIPSDATHLVLRADCPASGACAAAQVRHAQQSLGFGDPRRVHALTVLRRLHAGGEGNVGP